MSNLNPYHQRTQWTVLRNLKTGSNIRTMSPGATLTSYAISHHKQSVRFYLEVGCEKIMEGYVLGEDRFAPLKQFKHPEYHWNSIAFEEKKDGEAL